VGSATARPPAEAVTTPTGDPKGRNRPDLRWSVGVSVLAAFALIALGLEADAAGAGASVAFLASSLSCAALPVALRHPLGATVMQGVATVALGLGASAEPGESTQVPVVSIGVLVVHVGLVAVHHNWRVAVGVWWTLNGVRVGVAAVHDGITKPDGTTTVGVLALSSLVVLLAGIGYQQRVRIREELAAARRDVALEQERRSLAEERTRIARELHDVVAHSMSVIHMQATSAPYRLPDLDPATRAEFTSIAAGARGALGEMRQLLGVLRGADAEPDTAPAPGVAELPALVEVTSRSGGPCTLVVDADAGDVPATVGTTIYRIVQEALSNVVRHANGAAATVQLSREREGVTVTIVNGAGGRAGFAALDDPDRARHGLIGMRERVAHLGGELSHGPEPDGGFRVTAWLPGPAGDNA
jgi:signal transduction histidine kinase